MFDPTERVKLGRSEVMVTRLGLGAASIGGLFSPVTDDAALAVVRRAWDLGVRTFDVAPLYGYGSGERRLGAALGDRPRAEFTISTKVGRLVRRAAEIPAGADVDRQRLGDRADAYYADVGDRRMVFDYSFDGVLRSVDESLTRLGMDRVDVLLIHDPDDHWEAAIGGAYPALRRLRDEGVVGAIGVGMNQSPMLARFATEGDFDVFLVAGRYSLLDQEALKELLPICDARRIGVLVGGVMNSGVLARPDAAAHYDYRPAAPTIVERARQLTAICDRHGVSVRAAAIQFPLAHPAVCGIVAGVRSVEHLEEYPAFMRAQIPDGLWDELRQSGLVHRDAPVPRPIHTA
jgi:D-threo-aldose 1-dehydrogenase